MERPGGDSFIHICPSIPVLHHAYGEESGYGIHQSAWRIRICSNGLGCKLFHPEGIYNLLTLRQEDLGTTFWIDVPDWVQVPGLCSNLQTNTTALRYKATVEAPSGNNASASQARQTSSSLSVQNVLGSSTQGPSNSQGVPKSSAAFNQGRITPNQASQPSPSQQQSVSPELHVFMTSKVGGDYLLSQWNTSKPRSQNDREFFKELRKRYVSARGFWRYHLGFKVFSHCEFYRVSRPYSQKYASTKTLYSSGSMDGQLLAHQERNYQSAPNAVRTHRIRVLNIGHITMLQSQQHAIRL